MSNAARISVETLKTKTQLSKGSALKEYPTLLPAKSTCHHTTLCSAARTARATIGNNRRELPTRHEPASKPCTIHNRVKRKTAHSNADRDQAWTVPYGIAVSAIR